MDRYLAGAIMMERQEWSRRLRLIREAERARRQRRQPKLPARPTSLQSFRQRRALDRPARRAA